MSSVGRAVSTSTPAESRRAGYAFCPVDSFWFRPSYTDGKCPLCGEVVDAEAAPVTMLGRSWYGLAGLALLSLVMLALVLVMYIRG